MLFNDHPDVARFDQLPQAGLWLVNTQEGLFLQIKPDVSTEQPQFVVLNTYRWGPVLGQPVRQQRMLHHLGVELWRDLQNIGWMSCSPPQR
mgnify:CR=1 FL=1